MLHVRGHRDAGGEPVLQHRREPLRRIGARLVRGAHVDLVHLVEVAVDDGAAGQHQVVRGIIIGVIRHVTVGQNTFTGEAATVGPVLVE